MVGVSGDLALAQGHSAWAAGRWPEPRVAFERSLAEQESPDALFGLAMVLWWLGENQPAVDRCARAYALFRRSGGVPEAVRTAVWLAITYKANFGNVAAATGWVARAERLLEPLEPGPLHGWAWVARAYRMADVNVAEDLTTSGRGGREIRERRRSQAGRLVAAGFDPGGQGTDRERLRADRRGDGCRAGRRGFDTGHGRVHPAATCSTPASWSPTSNAPRSGAPTRSSTPTAARSCMRSAGGLTRSGN
jgi:hypothetical protein